MTTEYDIRCSEHNQRWGDARSYQIPILHKLIAARDHIVALADVDGDVTVQLLGCGDMTEFFCDHSQCDLSVWTEYGEEIPAPPSMTHIDFIGKTGHGTSKLLPPYEVVKALPLDAVFGTPLKDSL